MLTRCRVAVIFGALLLCGRSFPARATCQESPGPQADCSVQEGVGAWSVTVAGGLGAREVSGRGFGVPYVGVWAAKTTSRNLEIVYEGLVLTPTTKTRGPDPIGFAPELNMAGTSMRSVADVAFGALVRVNYYFRAGRVRPYATLGGGGVYNRRTVVRTRVSWILPDGVPVTDTRRSRDDFFALNSVAGAGVRIGLSGRWSLRSEARIPFVPAPPFHPTSSVALVIGITFAPDAEPLRIR